MSFSRQLRFLVIACLINLAQSGLVFAQVNPDATSKARLNIAIDAFHSDASEASASAVMENLKAVLASGKMDVVSACPNLSALGLKVTDGMGYKLFYVPNSAIFRCALVEWREVKPKLVRHASTSSRRRHPLPPQVSFHVNQINFPANVSISDARFIPLISVATKTGATEGHTVTKHIDASTTLRMLMVVGNDPSKGTVWLQAYKLVGGAWREAAEPVVDIPPFLLTNAGVKVSFDGNDLVITVPATEDSGELPYRIGLHMVGGVYTMEGKPSPDSSFNAAYQFVQAVEQSRLDLAKGWLANSSLISIPRYLGLFGKGNVGRLITAGANGNRFRLVTSTKDDLIIDVGKVKGRWAVVALFVAPEDTLWKKIIKSTVPLGDSGVTERLTPTLQR